MDQKVDGTNLLSPSSSVYMVHRHHRYGMHQQSPPSSAPQTSSPSYLPSNSHSSFTGRTRNYHRKRVYPVGPSRRGRRHVVRSLHDPYHGRDDNGGGGSGTATGVGIAFGEGYQAPAPPDVPPSPAPPAPTVIETLSR